MIPGELVGEDCKYNLRNAEDISIPMGTKQGYVNYFFKQIETVLNLLNTT